MKKFFLLVITMTACIENTHAEVFTNQLGNKKSFTATIADHNHAYNELDKEKSNIITQQLTEYVYSRNNCGACYEPVLNYKHSFKTEQAKKAHVLYEQMFGELSAQTIVKTSGDAFLLGTAIALINKAISRETFNKKALWASTAAALGLVIYQSKVYNAPYFDTQLNPQDNYFDIFSGQTLAKTIASVFTAIVGYAGTSYGLNKLSNLFTAEKAPLETLNQ